MEKLGSPEPAHPVQGAEPVAGVSVAKTAGAERDETPAAVINSKLCVCLGRWLPLVYREELYHVLRLTGPLLLSRILNFLLPFVTTIFCGHIGTAELAGYALGSATINVTTTSTGFGFAMACDTLISQTYGGKNLKRVGVILQRSIVIMLLFCLPCWGLLINSHNLLVLLHQDNEVARIAQLYVTAFLPAIPAMFLHQLQVAYLQNQGIILPQMYTAIAANLFNLGINYVLIFVLDLGVVGSAVANSLSQIAFCLLLFGYIIWKGLHKETWGGWSTECLQEWDSYMKLAVASVFTTCFEWWIWEIGGFLTGVLGESDLAAQHVLLETGAITYMFPLGVHAAACVRVGNALGAGNTSRALLTCKVVLILIATVAVIQGIIITGCKPFIAYIFTTDEHIVEIASDSFTVYTFVQFFDALLCVSSGILVGCGMQKITALTKLVCSYIIGLPVIVALMFLAKLRILGFWLGLFVCVFLESSFFIFLIYKLNWKKVTQKAQKRAASKLVSTVLNEGMVSDISEGLNTAQSEAPNADGYSPVITQDQDLKTGVEAVDNNTNTGGAEGDAGQSRRTSNAKTQAPLSVTQLILRRGLTFAVLVVIMAIGVAFHFAYPPPEPSAHSMSNFTLNWANDSTPTPLAPLLVTQKL